MAERTCSIDDCDVAPIARGWCPTHYSRWIRLGDPLIGGSIKREPRGRTVEDRFWEKVDRRGVSECWPWVGPRLPKGYGYLSIGGRAGRKHYAHRLSYRWWSGIELESGDVVRHTCDNPPCVNPAHLRLGTTADNVADKVRRGRQPRGSRMSTAKLTEAEVVHIRRRSALGESNRALAVLYGVSPSNISMITTRKTWRHVT